MKGPDLDKLASEEKHAPADFLKLYNKGIPSEFPRASIGLLDEYKKAYPSQFKPDGKWSLDLHRKKFMDWLTMHMRINRS
jgi:hypothetical protein